MTFSFVLSLLIRTFARKIKAMAEHNELGLWGEEVAADYLQQAANHYVKYRRIECPIRFDIVTVVGNPEDEAEIEHIKDAF